MSAIAALWGAAASAASIASMREASSQSFDVAVIGTGIKESLLAGILARSGKRVLQLEGSSEYGGEWSSASLDKLLERTGEEGPAPSKLGPSDEYSVDPAPKFFLASGRQLQLLVLSGAWHHMEFKRVHRSLIYRTKADHTPDVHRVLANAEDILKTRMLPPLEKAKLLQLFLWIEKFDESNPATHKAGTFSSHNFNLRHTSAAAFLKYWELPEDATQMLVRGMALHSGTMKSLKKMPALTLVKRLKRYKDAYKTFSHMTSPYVYPQAGFGSGLPAAVAHVLEENGGGCLVNQPVERILYDEQGTACGVVSGGVEVKAGCVISSPELASKISSDLVAPSYKVVRLYAVLAHPPNMCKDSRSCQLLFPAAQCGRKNDIFLVSSGPAHGVAPKGKWLVVVSARVEGSVDGLSALAVARRELAAALPILKPARKLCATLIDVLGAADGVAEGLVIPSSCDETSHFDSVEAELEELYERVSGEPLASLATPRRTRK